MAVQKKLKAKRIETGKAKLIVTAKPKRTTVKGGAAAGRRTTKKRANELKQATPKLQGKKPTASKSKAPMPKPKTPKKPASKKFGGKEVTNPSGGFYWQDKKKKNSKRYL